MGLTQKWLSGVASAWFCLRESHQDLPVWTFRFTNLGHAAGIRRSVLDFTKTHFQIIEIERVIE